MPLRVAGSDNITMRIGFYRTDYTTARRRFFNLATQRDTFEKCALAWQISQYRLKRLMNEPVHHPTP